MKLSPARQTFLAELRQGPAYFSESYAPLKWARKNELVDVAHAGRYGHIKYGLTKKGADLLRATGDSREEGRRG